MENSLHEKEAESASEHRQKTFPYLILVYRSDKSRRKGTETQTHSVDCTLQIEEMKDQYLFPLSFLLPLLTRVPDKRFSVTLVREITQSYTTAKKGLFESLEI